MPMRALGKGGNGHDIAIPCLHLTPPVGVVNLRSTHAQLESGKPVARSRSRGCKAQLGVSGNRVQNCRSTRSSPVRVPTTPSFDPLLNLSGFDGDSAEALRALHAYLATRLPDCSLTLIQLTGFARGQCRLAGQIEANGRERVANIDPLGEHSRGKVFGDALTRALLSRAEATRSEWRGTLSARRSRAHWRILSPFLRFQSPTPARSATGLFSAATPRTASRHSITTRS